MARIRTVKPSFFSSLSNAELPIPTRLTFIGLWTYADDKGRGVDDARLVKAAVWPLDEAYTTKKITSDLDLLEKAGKIRRYTAGDRRYFVIVEWHHQRIDKPQKSVLPAPPWESDSGNVPGTLPPNDGTPPRTTPPQDGGEVEGKGSGREVEGKANQSSSSDDGDPPASADDDGAGAGFEQAVAECVDRRMARAHPNDPKAYRHTVVRSVADELGPHIRRMLAEGSTVAEVCDALEPVTAPAGTVPEPTREHVPSPFDEVWNPATQQFEMVRVSA